ncbi:hypothetical protein V1511DRAFT_499365 [Dipodascopsis uninucleata]
MSSSLCGPSTALQSMQKHANTDRSLQQDRMASFSSPSDQSVSFRQDHVHKYRQNDMRAADMSYAAFLDHQSPSAGSPDVIDEFVKLRVSEEERFRAASAHELNLKASFDKQRQRQPEYEQSIESQHIHLMSAASTAGQVATSSSNAWHQDFMQFLGDSSASASSSYPESRASTAFVVPQNYAPYGVPSASRFPIQNVPLQSRNNISMATDKNKEMLEQEYDKIEELVRSRSPSADILGSMEQEQGEESSVAEKDDDGLALVAGDVLDSLSSNQSQKFKDSSFLALMRRLHNKEVVVQGNKMVEVVSNDNHANMASSFEAAKSQLAVDMQISPGAWEETF